MNEIRDAISKEDDRLEHRIDDETNTYGLISVLYYSYREVDPGRWQRRRDYFGTIGWWR